MRNVVVLRCRYVYRAVTSSRGTPRWCRISTTTADDGPLAVAADRIHHLRRVRKNCDLLLPLDDYRTVEVPNNNIVLYITYEGGGVGGGGVGGGGGGGGDAMRAPK